jgi:hypothetical protein
MFNRKYISKMFYIHRELGVALMLAISACIELLCGLVVDHPWQYLAWTFAGLLALIAALLVRNVIRAEREWENRS